MNFQSRNVPVSSTLVSVDNELKASFDFHGTTTTVIVRVKNVGNETNTLVGSGWSYPFKSLTSEFDQSSAQLPSLDASFQRPIPVVPGATVSVPIALVFPTQFSVESDAFGCLGLFTDSSVIMCPVRLCLLPVFTISTDTFTVTEPKPYPISVTLQSASEIPEIASIDGLGVAWTTKRLSPRQFQLSCVWTPPRQFSRDITRDSIALEFEGITHRLSHPIQINLQRCAEPSLRFASENPAKINRGRQKVYSFQVTNIGFDTLTIQDIVAIQPENGQAIIPDHGLTGLRLGAQESVTVPILVSVNARNESDSFGIQVFSNSPSLPIVELKQPVEVASFPISSTPIGFDFGTVNSCAGYVDETFMEVSLVKVPVEVGADKFQTKEIFPSVLHLETMPCVGNGAYFPSLSFVTQRNDTINVRELKTAFCRGEQTLVCCADGVERAFNTSHFISQFLANLLSHTENLLGKTFNDAVITVPTKFGKRAVDNMVSAISAIGLEPRRIHIYDEATSAAMFYIRRGRDSDFLRDFNLPEKYSMAIIDIGGGTTDVSLLDVSDIDSADARHLEVTLRGTTGRIRFGGTHFNSRIEGRWFSDYADACASAGIKATTLDNLDDEQQQEMIAPRADLRESIEATKCLLAAQSKLPYGTIDRPLACCKTLAHDNSAELPADKVPEALTNLSSSTLGELLGGDLSDIMAEVELIARMLAKHPLGVVLVVGQSGQLETVRNSVISTFTADKVGLVPGDTAKSCVVKGALELHQLLTNPGGIAFRFQDLSRVLNARLGMLWSGRQEMEFKEIIPIGVDLPAQGTLDLPVQMFGNKESFSIDLIMNYGGKDAIKGNENIARLGRFTCELPPASDSKRGLLIQVDENMVVSAYLVDGENHLELNKED